MRSAQLKSVGYIHTLYMLIMQIIANAFTKVCIGFDSMDTHEEKCLALPKCLPYVCTKMSCGIS